MELSSTISLAFSVVAVCVTVIFGIAIWRKNNTDEMRQENRELREKNEACQRDLASKRDENYWLLQRVQRLEGRLEDRRGGGSDKGDH